MRRCETAALVSAAVCGGFALVLLILAETSAHFSILAAVFTAGRACTGLLVYAGLRISRHRSERFSEGLYKLENLIAVVIGALIVIAAWELGRYAVAAYAAGRDLLPNPLGSVPYLAAATVLGLGLAVMKWRVAGAELCPSLRADAWHSSLDTVALGAMTVGSALAGAGVQRADELVAFLACAILFATGAHIIFDALKVLLDASVERGVLADVERIVAADPRVTRVVEVSGRNAGSYRLLTVRLTPVDTGLRDAEVLTGDLREAIRGQIANVGDIVIDLAPAGAGESAAGEAGDGELAARPGESTAGPGQSTAGSRESAAGSRTAGTGAAAAARIPGSPGEATAAGGGTAARHRLSRAERAEVISTGCSIVMAAAMMAAALTAGSVAVLAEATDTIVDIVASIAVLVGMRLSRRHSKTFPQGLYKLENLIAAGIGILVLISAYELAREAIDRIVNGSEPLESPLLVILIMVGVVITTALLGRYKSRVGREERSPSLQADGRHALSDAAACAGVTLGVGLQWAGVPYTDSIAALVVVALLFWTGAEVLLAALRVLLDASLEPEVLDGIRVCVEEQPGVERVLSVRGRNSGAYRFVTLTVVPKGPDLAGAEHMLDGVRHAVCQRFENVDRIDVELAAG